MLVANRLADGRVVFLAPHGRWAEDIGDGCLASSKEQADELLALGRAAEAANQVVEPYLIAVRATGEVRRPVEWREAIRALGPTVRTDLPLDRETG
jgi:hypothetical protein